MIVIPMAGLSSRFYKAGYDIPKYMLEAKGKSIFEHSVGSFSKYFSSKKFVFIIRNICDTKAFVKQRAELLGIKEYDIVTLNSETRGQAETVALGLESYKDANKSITIFNIDTFRPGFLFPNLSDLGNGYLEVFKGSGCNWSYVKPIGNGSKISLTAEKNPISNLCCTGLYHFSHIKDFFEAYQAYASLSHDKWEKGELYVAPLYNFLINNGRDIHYNLIEREEVVFCGTPEEYKDFL